MKINIVDMYKLELNFPSPKEQRKIAEFFSLLDKQIELWERKLQLNELLFQRYVNFKILESKKLNISEISYLKDIAIVYKGEQVNRDLIVTNGYRHLNGGKTASNFYSKYNVDRNSITISEGGESCGFVNFNKDKIWAGGHLYVIVPNNYMNVDYVFWSLKNMEIQIMKKRVGSGLPNIQINDIKNLQLYVTTNSKFQNEQSVKWIIFNEYIEKIKIKIRLTKLTKKYYLCNMFI